MKKVLVVFLIAALAAGVASLTVARYLAARNAAERAASESRWQAERASLEAALMEAESRRGQASPGTLVAPSAILTSVKPSPVQIIAELRTVMAASGDKTRAARRTIYLLESLLATGTDALSAIRAFLARNEDIDLVPPKGVKGGTDDFVPVSLRFGLFDVAKQIGGADAEQLLAEILITTGRGAEVAWLARALQQIAPGKYREAALAAAHELLGRPPAPDPATGIDRNERELLFGVLTMYGDTSYVSLAQAQLVRADGAIDRNALRYLQQSLGQQAVPIAAQMYDDLRLTESAKKEPFARLALNYVGADAQADAFYQKAINDMNLNASHRKNLIEDLNQDGFADTKNLTARDLQLIQNRITLIEQLAPSATDPANVAAFKEAHKDLLKMLERASRPPQAAP
jgi:hypothetical protein